VTSLWQALCDDEEGAVVVETALLLLLASMAGYIGLQALGHTVAGHADTTSAALGGGD
jgi:Flp pilus assembly pilin Flp